MARSPLTLLFQVHATNPTGRLLREGSEFSKEESVKGEILKIVATLPFSDDAFKVYSCETDDNNGVVISKKVGKYKNKKNSIFGSKKIDN